MAHQLAPSKAVHIALWATQIILAAAFTWGGLMKLCQPAEKLAEMWPWAAQVSPGFLTFTAITDLAGALGLILPGLLRLKPRLTVIAAFGIIALMIAASVFHIARGEASSIGANVVFGLMAAFIARGRLRKALAVPK